MGLYQYKQYKYFIYIYISICNKDFYWSQHIKIFLFQVTVELVATAECQFQTQVQ